MDEYIYNEPVYQYFQVNLNQLFRFVREKYGEEKQKEYIERIAIDVYKPLIERIKKSGLGEWKHHLERTFSKEPKGKYEINYKEDRIVLNVKRCPAINYLKNKHISPDINFCKSSTKIINEIIANECELKFEVKYDQDTGECVQTFWKE